MNSDFTDTSAYAGHGLPIYRFHATLYTVEFMTGLSADFLRKRPDFFFAGIYPVNCLHDCILRIYKNLYKYKIIIEQIKRAVLEPPLL
jgi:hypothetical protein